MVHNEALNLILTQLLRHNLGEAISPSILIRSMPTVSLPSGLTIS